MRSFKIMWGLVLLLSVPNVSFSHPELNDTINKVDIPQLSAAPKIENFLSMRPDGEIERQMMRVSGFFQRRPSDGEPSEQQTEVYLSYDDRNLYAVFLAFDKEPEKIRARMNRRENIFSDDIVEIMIDTFRDQRRAYAFAANPLGVQWDALWTEGRDFDDSFDTLWHSKGRVTDQGYVVWMAIPFASLRFSSEAEQEWGLIFIREIRRGSFEQSSWPHVSVKVEGRLNQAATLRGLRNLSPSRNMQFIPYSTFRSFRLLDQPTAKFVTDQANADAGVDAKFGIKDNLVLDVTANPDFSQVESDAPQVTVNRRFEVFFPEKRPFFLENANLFRTPINLVFTRRISNPQFGARLSGKIGAYAVGGLLMDDQAPGRQIAEGQTGHGKRAGFGILRVSRDILNQSTLGMIFTDREFADQHNRVGGVDGRLKFNKNWVFTFQGVMSSTRSEETSLRGKALDAVLDRNGRKFNYHLHYTDVDPDFRTQPGFIRRPDIRTTHQNISYRFRPEGKLLISWGPTVFNSGTWDYAGNRLDRSHGLDLGFSFSGQTNVVFFFNDSRELLRPQDFSQLPANTDFTTDSKGFFFNTSVFKQMSLNGSASRGDGINFVPSGGQAPKTAERTSARINLTLRPNTTFRFENAYILSHLEDKETGEKVFTNHILRSRINWQFNRKLSLRFIVEYNANLTNAEQTFLNTRKRINGDFLFTYLVNPWTAFYIGANSNYRDIALIAQEDERQILAEADSFLNDSRQIFLKYSYLFRL